MRVSSKGQVTIPKGMRERAGMRPGTEVEFALDGDVVSVRRTGDEGGQGTKRGEKIVAALQETRTKNRRLSTDDLMRLLRGDG